MPKFTVETQCTHSAEDAFSRIKDLLNNDAELRKYDTKLRCEFNDTDLTGLASGGMFSAALKVQPEASGSKVAITVDLPLSLSLFKGKIQQILEKKLESKLIS